MYDRVAKKVIVDAGHGGKDPGAINGNIYEKDFNLQSAQYIYNRLRELGIPAELTRTGDTSLPKNERIAKIKNLGIDPNVILVSNHINSGGGEGAEVVYALRNNNKLANMILDNIGSEGQIKRKVYQRRLPENPSKDYYYIIRETTPSEAVLIEYGFIDNLNDLRKLQNNLTDYAEGVVKALADYMNVPYTKPGNVPPVGEDYYTVVNGDTLWSIANRYGLTVDELKRLNNLESDVLSVGQRLLVRTSSMPTPEDVYTVLKGDTLWSIANKFGLTVDELKRLNNLESDMLSVGQTLVVKSNSTIPMPGGVYIVQSGDSLWGIARKFNVSVDDLIQYNNLSTLTLQVGQKLRIPNGESNKNTYHTVQNGDTLWSIAKQYNISVNELMNANGLTSTLLKLNQVLVIPA